MRRSTNAETCLNQYYIMQRLVKPIVLSKRKYYFHTFRILEKYTVKQMENVGPTLEVVEN